MDVELPPPLFVLLHLLQSVLSLSVANGYTGCLVDVLGGIQEVQNAQEDLLYCQHDAQDLAKVWTALIIAEADESVRLVINLERQEG